MTPPVVLVTGASRGIGKEIALGFGRRKAQVAVHCLSQIKKASEVCREISRSGGEGISVTCDVRDSSAVDDMIQGIVKKWGRLDVLINNAGTAKDRTILKMSDEEWKEVVDVNLTGAFWCLRAACRLMAQQKDGAIINIGSLIGLRGSIGNANYAVSKGGLVSLTKAAAREMGRFSVRVNCILPGFHVTDISRQVWEKYRDRIVSEHVLERLVDSAELADFVVHVAQQKSASGQVFNFDSRLV